MLYVVLLCLWPVLTYVQENFEKLNGFWEVFLIASVMVFLGLSFVKLVDTKRRKLPHAYLFFLLAGIALFFNYVVCVDFFVNPYVKASYLWGGIGLVILGVAWQISSRPMVQQIIKPVILVLFFFPSLSILPAQFFSKKVTFPSVEEKEEFVLKHKPNIYYFLVDGYARQDTLKEVARFDNEPFLKKMEEEGFLVSRNAYSNYHFTGASLSSTMNMHYHRMVDGLIPYPPMGESLKGDNLVRKILRNNGYKIINIPAHWHQMGGYGYEDVCIKNNAFEIYESFLSATPLRALNWKNHYVSNEDVMGVMGLFPESPKFIFAHFAQIHDAIYDENGEFVSVLHPALSNYENSRRYVHSVSAMNQKLLELVDHIRKKDPQAVVIIQADHGPTYTGSQEMGDPSYWVQNNDAFRLRSSKDHRYVFGILSAIYLPEYDSPVGDKVRSYFSGHLTLINVFRGVFSYLSHAKTLNLLKDDSHFLYMDEQAGVYREVDIEMFKKRICS